MKISYKGHIKHLPICWNATFTLDTIYPVFLYSLIIHSRYQCASANTWSIVLQLAQPSLHHISYVPSNCWKKLVTRASTLAAEVKMSKTEVSKSKLKTWSPRLPYNFTDTGKTSTCSSMFMLGGCLSGWGWMSLCSFVCFGAFPISFPLFVFMSCVCQVIMTSFVISDSFLPSRVTVKVLLNIYSDAWHHS